MDTTVVTIDVDETCFHHHPSTRNPVCINLFNRVQIFAIESSETKTCTGLYPSTSLSSQINLDLHNYEFSPSYLFSLIDPHLLSPHKSGLIADEMAYRMFVNVVTTENVFFTVSVSRHPEKERRKEEEDESTCAICLDDLLKDEDLELSLSCSHRFHLRCIGEWLLSRNSCSLCREKLLEESDFE